MDYLTLIYLPFLSVVAGIFLIAILFLIIQRKMCERMVDKTSGTIKSELNKEPPIELSEEEQRKYPRNLVITAFFILFAIILIYVGVFYFYFSFDSTYLSIHTVLFIGISTGLIFFVALIACALFISRRKLYRVKAYCYKISYGRQRSYYMVYYDFVKYSIECFPLNAMPSAHKLIVTKGSTVDILVIAGKKRLRPIDFMKRREIIFPLS